MVRDDDAARGRNWSRTDGFAERRLTSGIRLEIADAGDPIKQIGQIKSFETDVNSITGKSIEVRTNLMVHVDFLAGTTTHRHPKSFDG